MTTKAEMTREILQRDLGKKPDEEILDAVIKKTGLSKSLAKVYVRENQERLKQATAKEPGKVAKKASSTASKQDTKLLAGVFPASSKSASKKRPKKKTASRTSSSAK